MTAAANPWTTRIIHAYKKSLDSVLEVGHLLKRAKEDLPHGEFQRMIKRDLPFKERMARMYMEVARNPRFSKRQHAAVLPRSVDTLALIGTLSDAEFSRRLEAGEIHPEMTRKDASAMAKGQQTAMFDDPKMLLSGLGRGLERDIEQDQFAPDWQKLGEASGAIIEEIAASLSKLKRIVARIREPDGLEKFRAEFARMEKAVTERVEQYRQMTIAIHRLWRDADASLRHAPDD
jgi:hypothetical protein